MNKIKTNEQRCLDHQKFDDPAQETCLDCKNKKIAFLETQIDLWKDAWYKQRIATGKLAWEIPTPSFLSIKEQKMFLKLALTIKLKNNTSNE